MRSLEIYIQRIFNNSVKKTQKLGSPVNNSVQRPKSRMCPESRVQSPASRVRRPDSRVQSLASRVKHPESRVQSPASNTCVQGPGILVRRLQPRALPTRIVSLRISRYFQNGSKRPFLLISQTHFVKIIQIRENMDQKKLRNCTLFTQSYYCSIIIFRHSHRKRETI